MGVVGLTVGEGIILSRKVRDGSRVSVIREWEFVDSSGRSWIFAGIYLEGRERIGVALVAGDPG